MRLCILLSFLCFNCCSSPEVNHCPTLKESRCTATNKVELCGPNHLWVPLMDCQFMGQDWQCSQLSTGGYTCLPRKSK